MSAALLPSLSSLASPATVTALAAVPDVPRGRGRPTGGALPLPGPDAVAKMTAGDLAAHLADIQRRTSRVADKIAAAEKALAALAAQKTALADALKVAVHTAKTGGARLALEERARKAREAAERAAKEAADLGALLADDVPAAE